jgi:hypothetical protein
VLAVQGTGMRHHKVKGTAVPFIVFPPSVIAASQQLFIFVSSTLCRYEA